MVVRRRYDSRNQIFKEIMDLLRSQRGCQRWMTAKEISRSLHLERRAVWDAMRRLHEQGLVTTRSWANGFLEYSACDPPTSFIDKPSREERLGTSDLGSYTKTQLPRS
jgi:predicted DNA-binding transcriptional regulator